MILHNCPHCQRSSLFPEGVEGAVNCRSCGAQFDLSAFTRASPPTAVRGIRSIISQVRRIRSSRGLIYGIATTAVTLVLWLAASLFGLLPDEFRIVNRRFAYPGNWESVRRATGLIAVGSPNARGEIDFVAQGTAWAVAPDGFMLTSRHLLDSALPGASRLGIWVFFKGKRTTAEVVHIDAVADIAIVKIDAETPYRFQLPDDGVDHPVNRDIVSIGYNAMPESAQLDIIDVECALSRGTISRCFRDAAGTNWVEHTAAIKPGASGGPLVAGNDVIGLTVRQDRGFSQAIDLVGERRRIMEHIREFRERSRHRK